jgi:AraC-like DNA-binding protein
MASYCGISKRHLQRHFHDVFGLKLHQWLNELRLQDAARLLSADTAVKEVAFWLGFKNSNHFIRAFKKKHGKSPQKFARLKSASLADPQFQMEYLRLLQTNLALPANMRKMSSAELPETNSRS